MVWIKLLDSKAFPSRIAEAVLTPIDLINFEVCKDYLVFLELMEMSADSIEPIIKECIKRKYKIDNFYIWSMHFDCSRRAFRVLLDSPDFDTIPPGIEAPVLSTP